MASSSVIRSERAGNSRIANAVRDMYTSVATSPPPDLHFPVGREAARGVGYPEEELDKLPADALASFAGVAYPFMADAIREGDTVLDVGCGSGTDLLLAASRVGAKGRAFGLDFTPAMLEKAMRNIERVNARQAFVLMGDASDGIPLPDASADVVTSNGVVNLIPDKAAAFREIHRVLKPGGRLQLADIVVNVPIPEGAREDATLWAACIAGADLAEDYVESIRAAGFENVRMINHFNYFALAPRNDARETAARYQAEALVVAATKKEA